MWDLIGALIPHLYFFLNEFFLNFQKNYQCWIKYISKKFTTTGSANTCILFCIFEKNYNDWIKSFSKSKWTGLKSNFVPSQILNIIRKFRKNLTIMHPFSHMFQHSGTQNEIAAKNYVKRLLLLCHFRFRSQRTGSQLILIVLARDFRGFFRKKFADVADRIKASP